MSHHNILLAKIRFATSFIIQHRICLVCLIGLWQCALQFSFYSLVHCNCLVYLSTLHRNHDADQTKIETTTKNGIFVSSRHRPWAQHLHNTHTHLCNRLLYVQKFLLRWKRREKRNMKENDIKQLKRNEKQKCQNNTKSKWFVLCEWHETRILFHLAEEAIRLKDDCFIVLIAK